MAFLDLAGIQTAVLFATNTYYMPERSSTYFFDEFILPLDLLLNASPGPRHY